MRKKRRSNVRSGVGRESRKSKVSNSFNFYGLFIFAVVFLVVTLIGFSLVNLSQKGMLGITGNVITGFDSFIENLFGINSLTDTSVARSFSVSSYTPGSDFIVTLTVIPGTGNNIINYGIEETFPSGWTVGGITSTDFSGVIGNKIMWIVNTSSNTSYITSSRTLQYTLTPSASGTQNFNGNATFTTGSGAQQESLVISGSTSINQAVVVTPTNTLNVTIFGSGTVSGNGISCSSGSCTASYNNGTNVILTANPSTDYQFNSWSGDCSGTGSCTVNMSRIRRVNATFTPIPFAYTLNAPGVTIQQGTTAQQTITITKTAGLVSSIVYVNASNLPSGVTVSPSTTNCNPSTGNCQVTLTYTAQANAATGTFNSVRVNSNSTPTGYSSNTFSMGVTAIPTNTLNVTIFGSGTVSGNGISCSSGSCTASYNNGTNVILTANPSTDYQFNSWSGDCSGSGTCTVNMSRIRRVNATFTPIPFAYTLNAPGVTIQQGTTAQQTITITKTAGLVSSIVYVNASNLPSGVTVSPSTTNCNPSTGNCQVTLTYTAQANAATGTFNSVRVNSNSTPTGYSSNTFSMGVTAIPTNTLNVTIFGSGTVSGNGISCSSGSCTASYNNGTNVILTANPSTDYQFNSWSGDCSGSGTCTVNMSRIRRVNATFTPIPFAYTLNAPGVTIQQGTTAQQTITITKTAGLVSSIVYVNASNLPSGVTVSPSTTNCNPSTGNCQVTLTYTAQANAATGTFNSVRVNSNSTPTGYSSNTFSMGVTAIPTNTLSASISGSGRVISTPSGIDCSSLTCNANYENGTNVTLTAIPSTDYQFNSWSGDCSGTGTCRINVSRSRSVTATFTPIPFAYSLTVPSVNMMRNTSITQTVTVNKIAGAFDETVNITSISGLPNGVSVNLPQSCNVNGGTSCNIIIEYVANMSAQIVNNFEISLNSSSNSMGLIVNYNITVTAVPTNTLSTSISGSGRVISTPAGIDCSSLTCNANYENGTNVTLTATANSGNTFSGWSVDCSGTSTCTLNMSSARSVTATFAVVSSGGGGGGGGGGGRGTTKVNVTNGTATNYTQNGTGILTGNEDNTGNEQQGNETIENPIGEEETPAKEFPLANAIIFLVAFALIAGIITISILISKKKKLNVSDFNANNVLEKNKETETENNSN